MTRTLHNDAVEVDLGTGEWTARWRATGITFGPCRMDVESREFTPGPRAGSWHVETTRTGARARWTTSDDAAWIELHLPADGDVVEVQVGYLAEQEDALRALVMARGPIAPTVTRHLVNGYDSWSYAGVRDDATDSFWSTTAVTAAGGLALQARHADRYVTRIARDRDDLTIRSEGAPTHRPVEGTWGFETVAPTTTIAVRAGEEVVSEPIAVTAHADPLTATETVASLVDRRRWNGPPACGWESWYHYAIAITPENLLENARLLKERFGHRPGFDLFQIDDGWQQTYGAWWPRAPFPDDFGEFVEQIHALDLRCGLWLAPFMVVPHAIGLGAEHEDWCVRDVETGATFVDRHDRWALDASNPAVVDYLRDLGQTVRGWGVDMVKLDFLYLGAQEGARHDERVTGTQALRRGLGTFVDQLGDDVYVLGCGAPMLPMVGICHANRIGHDLAVPVIARDFGQPLTDGWTGWHGIRAQARQAAARWFTHGRWFHNDPEIVMAWGSDGRGGADGYSLEESHTQAVVAALTGGPYLLADELQSLLPEERAVLEDDEVLDLAWDERGFRPTDLFDHVDTAPPHAYSQPTALASTWVAGRAQGHVTATFTWTDEAATHDARFSVE
jgi:alpha-galactosidase